MTKTSPATSAGDSIVTMDRRREDRRQSNEGSASGEAKPTRRKTQRRRQIDPTTCERDYTNDEIEFMQAMDAYKRAAGRMFPTCSEILEVVRGLGYIRLSEEELKLLQANHGEEFNELDDASAEDAAFDADQDLETLEA